MQTTIQPLTSPVLSEQATRLDRTTPLHLSLDGALLLSLIGPCHREGPITEAHEVAGGLITVESTPNGWFGDYRVTAWLPLTLAEAEDHWHASVMDPDLVEPHSRVPLVRGEIVTDVNVDGVRAAVQAAREALRDRAAHAAASHVRTAVSA
jgi:hypothetical protein